MATPYRVSTITCNGDIGVHVVLRMFFDNVAIVPIDELRAKSSPGFVWAQFEFNEHRGVYPKKQKTKKKTSSKKTTPTSFDNQVTVIYYIKDGYMPNIKLFKNGNIHMTGVRTREDGQMIVEAMHQMVRHINASVGCVDSVRKDNVSQEIGAFNFIIRMINSDFSIPFRIRRKELHMLLISNAYSNISSFQPGTYPGVKVQYFFNKLNARQNGSCCCNALCDGKGCGTACKKVTIAIFESGKILITGANEFDQVDEAYKFICKVLLDNQLLLQKTLPVG